MQMPCYETKPGWPSGCSNFWSLAPVTTATHWRTTDHSLHGTQSAAVQRFSICNGVQEKSGSMDWKREICHGPVA